MNPLALRKQLLIAESDLNRTQLAREWQTMAEEVHALTRQARTVSFITSASVSLVAGLASLRCKKTAAADAKPSWFQTILKGAQLAGSLWSEFRPRSKS